MENEMTDHTEAQQSLLHVSDYLTKVSAEVVQLRVNAARRALEERDYLMGRITKMEKALADADRWLRKSEDRRADAEKHVERLKDQVKTMGQVNSQLVERILDRPVVTVVDDGVHTPWGIY
jgi:phosphoenolpyruvate carboxylase